jgi:hypothetical protein
VFVSSVCDGAAHYEEILVEMADVSGPMQRGPPWMQLLMLMAFNTALYVANGFLEKMFSVDILPIVGMMTGASPLDVPPPRPPTSASPPTPRPSAPPKQGESTAAAAATPDVSPFSAFMKNF